MVFFPKHVLALAFSFTLLPFVAGDAIGMPSPIFASSVDKNCPVGAKYTCTPKGKNVTIAGVPTYLATPTRPSKKKRVILFFSDVFGPSTKIVSSSKIISLPRVRSLSSPSPNPHSLGSGYHVLGIDYFPRDPLGNHDIDNELAFNITEWQIKSHKQARELILKWTEAVRAEYGKTSKYVALGYC
ncbi:hypothetical protein BKA70DRAFT_1224966 [Coprinopsis sp. MPI-PUGE-AT-0042]|nr:hypothetical protein BKA70DRAFT_1224966 [Coprinopsis sp. MPI-PUGE-AT-0042]